MLVAPGWPRLVAVEVWEAGRFWVCFLVVVFVCLFGWLVGFLAALGLCCCARAFSSCDEW